MFHSQVDNVGRPKTDTEIVTSRVYLFELKYLTVMQCVNTIYLSLLTYDAFSQVHTREVRLQDTRHLVRRNQRLCLLWPHVSRTAKFGLGRVYAVDCTQTVGLTRPRNELDTWHCLPSSRTSPPLLLRSPRPLSCSIFRVQRRRC